MPTILADSFIASLARLANNEQKQAKLTAFDLQGNPDHPSLKFHSVDISWRFPKPSTVCIAAKMINAFGDELRNVFGV
jgi:hypothetical protein